MKFVTRNKHNKTTGLNASSINIEGFSQIDLTWSMEQSGLFQYTLKLEKIEFADKLEPKQFELLLLALHALHAGHMALHIPLAYEINLSNLNDLTATGHIGLAHELHERLDEVDGIYGQLSGGLVFKAGWDAAPSIEYDYKSEDVEE